MARMSKAAKSIWKQDVADYKTEIRNARATGDADMEQWARDELKLFKAPSTPMAEHYERQAELGY